MVATNKALHELIIGNSDILAKLALNRPFWNKSGGS